ncbi:BCCT family transporter [Algicola sagamiensis]|uniref:BCCT family transporter n=1 Tax=Algicola sagamiensis TaxID=163869 RepID=UPI00037B06CE|nr:BCCT family transporter [Algicola sagamiensis]
MPQAFSEFKERHQAMMSKNVIGAMLCSLIAAIFLLFPKEVVSTISQWTQWVVHTFGLAFILATTGILLVSLCIAISPLGRYKLGQVDDQPEFGFFSWIAMLFAAGMGSGLIFWGIAEPVQHFINPPPFAKQAASPKETALALTYYHWGVHAWSIYAIAGLAVGWFAFRRNRSLNFSACFTPQTDKPRFQLLDLLAVTAVIFGVAGTLANSIALIQTGLEQVISESLGGLNIRLGLLCMIAFAFTASSLLGLERGIKRLSQFNLIFVLGLLLFVFFWMDPLVILRQAMTSTWVYIEQLPYLSLTLEQESSHWRAGWSVIYLIWWIAWAPFVGPFIARISRGRTIRQFVLCTILFPTITSIFWFSAFSGGLFEHEALQSVTQAVRTDYTQGLYEFFQIFPMTTFLCLLAILLLITFVITSADSAIYVTGLLTGQENNRSKLLWSTILIAITVALIFQNNIDLNKQVAIAGAIPFTLILIAQCIFLIKDMRQGSS